MKASFYKLKQYRAVSGVLAGLADKFDWDLGLTRALYLLFCFFSSGFGFFLYIALAMFLPYKEDLYEDAYGTGPRKRKDARAVEEDDNDGWYW
ncbi:PspC domain-containing protein [Streptococcus caprae]|uniref:PspC domain-containing protein n=1 Tax=Streptococcus caprae TaxID=1640501 RepID=A0ABV8CXB6_9STRE